jgi:hypothetical protein
MKNERWIDISHEALIRGWPKLRSWLDQNRSGHLLHQRITESAREWEKTPDESVLFRGARLAQAMEWRQSNESLLNQLEREFLDGSVRLKDREDQEARRGKIQSKRLKLMACALAVIVALPTLAIGYWTKRSSINRPVSYEAPDDHFKYGHIAGSRSYGIPYAVWKALPYVFGVDYRSFGFIYEPGKDLPIGVSKANIGGIDRVFLNCAACHTGTVRETQSGTPRIVAGMPANSFDFASFQNYLYYCAADAKLGAKRLLPEVIARSGDTHLTWIDRWQLRGEISDLRERFLALSQRFRFVEAEPDFGPGRIDTFNYAKALLNFRMEKLPEKERAGTVDFPSIWLHGKGEKMWHFWDGCNNSIEESIAGHIAAAAAFGTTIDWKSIGRIQNWLVNLKPPNYPFPINQQLGTKGEALYGKYCTSCHGRNGRDFSGEEVGMVTPIEEVKTDRHRLDSYTYSLVQNQIALSPDIQSIFRHFRKTFGYANVPLDGIWLRAPYLHNGSVPTLRDLLNPANERPPVFYRGYDVFDQEKVGFVSEVAKFESDGRSIVEPKDWRRYFRFDTREKPGGASPRDRNEGNSNAGHEGPAYGTMLSPDEKDAIVEYLKTF